MDDSELDFTDLCSRLLKRVRRKGRSGGSGDERKPAAEDEEPSSASSPRRNPPKRRRKTKDIKTEIKSNPNDRTYVVTQLGDVSQPTPVIPETVRVKDAVIRRMQQFKRAGPERLMHADTNQPTTTQSDGHVEIQNTGDVSSDEALALQLQQELDRESRAVADVEDGGLFFCQLCQRDLSAMSPQLRTQHINRCLDAGEVSAPSASHHSHPPHVPECPICGKSFKSEKSRSIHLKRCSTDMGVSPNDLLQALRRQAAETVDDGTTAQSRQTGVTKRRNGVHAKKKSRRKGRELDEDTMVALALSRSLLEQEREKEREMEEEREIQAQLLSPPATVAPVLQWKPAAGKGRGKRRKGASPVQPPLLLIQDPQTALNRLQERVSSLLLCSRSPSPPTPTLSPSTLPAGSHAPLWLKSALHGGGPDSVLEFYTSELSNLIQPLTTPEREKPKGLELTPVKQPPAPTLETTQKTCPDQSLPEHRSAPSPLTSCSGTPGTQAMQDLMELAEEGMTLTQYGYTTNTAKDKDDAVNELPSSGFVPETNDNKTLKTASVTVSKLMSDLSSMVNNPQLSDVQLQVDSGDVFFTHSFMLYTRCPLLANMVHDSGFGVQEEGMPVVQRVLLGDVPGAAVLAFLQYLYTAHCPLAHTLVPHVRQLADRFCLHELQQQCEEYSGSGKEDPRGESDSMFPAQEPHLRVQEDQNLAESNFLELLQSMWQHEDSEGEDEFKENASERGVEDEAEGVDSELKEDRVDEEELDEIYEFAATQRKTETMLETATETEDDEGDANKSIGNEKEDERIEKNETGSRSEKSVASFHSNEQGVDGTEAAMVTSPVEIHQNQNPDTGRLSESGVCENRNQDTSLDKSYERLFSQSVGEYMEPSQTPTSCQQQLKSSHMLQRNTPVFRPSCVSEVIDLSISPPLSPGVSGESSFPVPGVSPVLGKAEDKSRSEEISSSHRVSNPPSPPHSQQVELIVLSDSNDEMDVDLDHIAPTTKHLPGDGGLTPQSPLKSLSEPKSNSNACKGGLCSQNNLASASQSHDGKQIYNCKKVVEAVPINLNQSEHHSPSDANHSVFDGSAEVSWLIPATPVQVTRSSSAQTCVSMRRTQLFPKSCSSSSSSSSSTVFDSSKPSAHFTSTSNGSSPGREPEPLSKRQSNRPLETNQNPTKEHCTTDTKHSPGYQTPLHHLRLSQIPSKCFSDGSHTGVIIGCSTQSVPQPSSSTPLHLDSLQRQKGGKLSLQLSHSESSPSPCKTPEKKQNISSIIQSPNSPNYGQPERSRENQDEDLEQLEIRYEDQNHNVEEVLDVEVNSPQASFCCLDEPPIAFDDSWGLDGAVGSQKPCFSLRLDSSEGTGSPPGNKSKRHTASLPTTPPLATEAHTKTPEPSPPPFNLSLPDPDMWDDWEEKEEEPLPLSQRLLPPTARRVAELKTPVACRNRNKGPLVPITPMPGFSDMDTPELKNKLNRFGVRALPKKQMILKLKEIHHYTHQLLSSESEEETSTPRRPLRKSNSQCAQPSFKQPTAPPAVSPAKLQLSDEDEHLAASQDSTTSSTAESDRSNPELCVSEDDDSDSEGITASQAVVREKDKLLAVRRFILSDPKLYGRMLQYQPLPLAELQASLKAAGIRLGAAKLLDFLDSQCITFSTAKQGQSASSRRKPRRKAATSGTGDAPGRGRKKTAKTYGVA